jgi:hypothetical protein
MKTMKFECEDSYEAEKLAGLMSVQKDGTVWVAGVGAIVRNELVVQLKDRSSHSVVLKDSGTAERLRQLINDVVKDKVRISSTEYLDTTATINLV